MSLSDESDRSHIIFIPGNELAELALQHYEQFDSHYKRLIIAIQTGLHSGDKSLYGKSRGEVKGVAIALIGGFELISISTHLCEDKRL